MLLSWLFTCWACLSLISSLPIHHPEPNVNEKICFSMLTLLLSFCKSEFSKVCGKIPDDYSFFKLHFPTLIHSCLVMPYSNHRRHNSPSIPQTPYQTLITPCPNFEPIYQVILLVNSNAWNLSPAKRRILEKGEEKEKKKGEQGLKRKKR
jgi:hypothetical protein